MAPRVRWELYKVRWLAEHGRVPWWLCFHALWVFGGPALRRAARITWRLALLLFGALLLGGAWAFYFLSLYVAHTRKTNTHVPDAYTRRWKRWKG